MKLINAITKSFLTATLIFSVSSCSVTTSTSVGGINVDTSAIKFTADNSGTITDRADKTYSQGETANLSFTIKGLKIVAGKIKVNQDFIVKSEGKEVINQKNALGADGQSVAVEGVAADFNGDNGTVPSYVTIPIKENIKGNITVSLTIRDLNASGSMATFETNFTAK